MSKKIISVLLLICMFIGLLIPQTVMADSTANSTGSLSNLSVQIERIDPWFTWNINKLLKHGDEDWFKNDNVSDDFDYRTNNVQFIKIVIKNESSSDIILDRDNQLILQFTNSSGKELGLKLYDFAAYENISKSTRNYIFGSSWLSFKNIKKNSTYEIYGYTKWMNYSDLSCSILNQVNSSDVKVRLTQNNINKDASTDRIHALLKLYNEGDKEIDLDKIRIHYYFKIDGDLQKVEPQAEKVEGKIYNYESDRQNPHEYVIQNLPYTFINMEQYSSGQADSYIEIGFPSKDDNEYDYYGNFIYKFLKFYDSDHWLGRYYRYENDWLNDILEHTDISNGRCKNKDNPKHRWWWKWDFDYTKSSQDYILSSKSSKGTSYVTVDMEIIKRILDGVTGDTSVLRKFNQSNHYSFNPGNEIDWDKVTVYYDGKLVWGSEPGVTLTAPENLTATAKKEGIQLQWNDVAGAEGYELYRKGPDDTDFVEIPDGIDSNSFLDNNVDSDQLYSYKVRAVSDNGQQKGPFSNVVNIRAINMLGNGLYAEYYNWKSIKNSSLNNYWYDLFNLFTTNYIMTNTDLALARIDPKIDFTGDNQDTYYRWGKIAPDSKVNADHYSVVWSGYVMPNYSEKYTFYTNTDDGVKLWIDLDRNGTFENDELLICNWIKHSETENSIKNIALQKDLKYKIKMEYFENEVDAVSQLLWSSKSQDKEVIPSSQLFYDSGLIKPQKPSNLKAVVQDDMSVNLTWESVLDAKGYIIYETDSNGVTREINVPNNNYYTIPPLTPGEYTYSVSAYNNAGESEKSDEVKVRVGLPAPANLQAVVNDKSVNLMWDAVNGATGYKIYRNCDGIIVSFLSDTNKYADNDVSWGETYTYQVVALKNEYEGLPSNKITVNIPASAPTKLTANLINNGVELKWVGSSGAQNYKIFRSESVSGPYQNIASATGTSYIDNTIPDIMNMGGKVYYYKVAAVSNGVDSRFSNIAEIKIYPYKTTDLGLLRSNIISKSDNQEFILGSYIPVEFELIVSDNIQDISISLNDIVDNNGKKLLNASMVKGRNNSSYKVYVDSNRIYNTELGDNNDIKIAGAFKKGTNIKIEFLLKVSATDAAISSGEMESNYIYNYNLKFALSAYKQDSQKSQIYCDKYIDGSDISLSIKVSSPNKLN